MGQTKKPRSEGSAGQSGPEGVSVGDAGDRRSTTQNALREARRRFGLVTVTDRRRAKSLPDVIEIVSAEWAAWLKLGVKGYWVQNIPTGDDCSNEYR